MYATNATGQYCLTDICCISMVGVFSSMPGLPEAIIFGKREAIEMCCHPCNECHWTVHLPLRYNKQISQAVLSCGICGMHGITILLLLHFQKLLNMTLAALACLRMHPPLRHNKCQSSSTVLWHLWRGWQHISIASLFPQKIIE